MDERTCCTVYRRDELQFFTSIFCPDSGCIASADAVLVCCRDCLHASG